MRSPNGHVRSVLRRLGVDIAADEVLPTLIMALNVLLLLTAYYFLKPVRKALFLTAFPSEVAAKYEFYLTAVIALCMMVLVPAWGRLVDRVPTRKLVPATATVAAGNLVVFYLLSLMPSVRPYLAPIFYAWLGVFSMAVVSIFWSFANELFTEEEGKRLFPFIGVGQSAGALVGGVVTALTVRLVGNYNMLWVAAVVLLIYALLLQVLIRREGTRLDRAMTKATEVDAAADTDRQGAYRLVITDRYVLLVMLFTVTFTLVNTNGEYLLSELIPSYVSQQVAAGLIPAAEKGEAIAASFSSFYAWVSALGLLVQTFLVANIIRTLGVRIAFFILPVIALGDATAVAMVPALSVLWFGKIAENATDYSLNNTIRNVLWLPTSREVKYKAKFAIDTVFVRLGDVVTAGIVFVVATVLGFGDDLTLTVRTIAGLNVLLVFAWLWIARAIVKENARLSAQETSPTVA